MESVVSVIEWSSSRIKAIRYELLTPSYATNWYILSFLINPLPNFWETSAAASSDIDRHGHIIAMNQHDRWEFFQ